MKEKAMGNLKRNILYVGIFVAFFAAVAARIQMVKTYRAEKIVSYYDEWQKRGKPVVAKTVEASDVPVFDQFTVRVLVDGTIARGFVTGNVKDALKEGQEIYEAENRSVVCALVKSVAAELDIDTGMFQVEIEFNAPRYPGAACVVSAHTATLKDVLVVPNEVLDISGGEYFIWKNEDGIAKKYKVSLGSRNGYGAVVTGGMRPGDSVIFYGQGMLAENDKLLVIDEDETNKKEMM